jgi:FkbM family methyltransferase
MEKQVRHVAQTGTWAVRAREWHEWLTAQNDPRALIQGKDHTMDRFRIANERRSPQIRAQANECIKFLECYENFNYDINSNGERFVLETLSRRQLSCIFDVGANIGTWALLANQCLPNAKIHCFEIAKPTQATLKEQTKSLSNIIVNDFGLSDRSGETTLKFYPQSVAISSIIDFPHPDSYVLTKAPVTCGDLYMQKHGIPHIDFMKLDVEGAEDRVLQGFANALRNRLIDVIQFEYGRVNILTHFLLYDFYTLFRKHGYRVGKIYPNYVDFREYSFAHEDFLGPNYLAVREELVNHLGLAG